MAAEKSTGEVVETFYEADKECTKHYVELKSKLGLADPKTLDAVFAVFDQWIALYKLTECDQMLTEVMPVCKARGRNDTYNIKAIQAMAFLRFKQFRFQDSLNHFLELKELLPPCSALLENTGHAYNSLQDSANAEKCFLEAVKYASIEEKAGRSTNKGGILLGLGLVKQKNHKSKEALPFLQQGLAWYKEKHPAASGDHSLVAKSEMYVAEALEDLGELQRAEGHFREAVRIFRVTCGSESPLTATALSHLGRVLLALEKHAEAEEVLFEALQRNVDVDIFSVNVSTVAQVLVQLYQLQSREEGKRQRQASLLVPLCATAVKKLKQRNEGKMPRNGDSGVFMKIFAELTVFTLDFAAAEDIFAEAIEIFREVKTDPTLPPSHVPLIEENIQICSVLHGYTKQAKEKNASATASVFKAK